ncbi:similar to light harvesting protein [Cyanidioschyzon merolae strain 10D]|jgi:hypothetical protein|uniref:Similar to light harvesting protein n=3 Tax=Cyanidioschyzon merolae (strain NIES-3377 / 10D) TaxID=280699 RepID=M1VKK5_CYAM1|nr:similar to light harvesting protein [Cyanidioschyzon merolae strain 10D]6FOS_4 Chain 4, Similar to light harvesting protein [Cyanidioschyzon merolae strain 10D]BAM82048.1 similar to light harvesting protein [Cyanidioschyzon merolae strain 10D]|eukprot:XP_005538084.1 similar to light harvesting protein [Cyanidioschyzon merolae strain 10D]
MYAFVSFAPLVQRANTVSKATGTSAIRSRHASGYATLKMEQSPALPFLSKPPNLSPDMPGYRGFDPLRFSDAFDVNWLQEGEIKNGRVAMLACLHFFVTEFYQFPFFAGAPKLAGPAHDYFVKSGAMIQILAFIGFLEFLLHRGKVLYSDMEWKGRKPGELGFNPLNLPNDKAMRDREVNNGRLAMLGFAGIIHGEFLNGKMPFEQITNFQPLQ